MAAVFPLVTKDHNRSHFPISPSRAPFQPMLCLSHFPDSPRPPASFTVLQKSTRCLSLLLFQPQVLFSFRLPRTQKANCSLSKTTPAHHSVVYGRFAAHRYPQNKRKTPGSVATGSVHDSGSRPSLARYALFSYSVKCLPILGGDFTYSFEKACSIARCQGHNHENEKYHL